MCALHVKIVVDKIKSNKLPSSEKVLYAIYTKWY